MAIDASELRSMGASIKTSSGRLGAEVAKVVRKSATAIERGAESRAPVRTGDLLGKITSTTITGDGRGAAMSAEISSNSDHGLYQEVGTSVMAPQPYLGPAFDAELPNFASGIAKAGGEIL